MAYEPREESAFGEFFDIILAARNVSYTRVYDDELIPSDIYVLKLQAADPTATVTANIAATTAATAVMTATTTSTD
jgi:hypothetical protein